MSMTMLHGFKRSLGRLAAISTTKMDNIIIFTSIAGWAASAAAQIFGIASNKNYSHEQKKYMINQELFDAGTNIMLYLGITKPLTFLASQMVKTAKLAPKSIIDFMRRTNIVKNRGKYGFDITQAKGFDAAGLRGKYNAFKCFAGATAATIGGVISSNIITPIVRNKIAAYRQNKYIERRDLYNAQLNKTNNNTLIQRPLYTTPRHSFDDYRARIMLG